MDQRFPSSPHRRQPRPAKSQYNAAVIGLGLCSNGLLGVGLIDLMQPSSLIDYVKIVLLVLAGATVTVMVNRIAIERGARLFVVGYTAFGLASIGAMGFVGTGLAMATFAGLTRSDVDKQELETHGRALSDAMARSAHDVPALAKATPLVRSIAADLAAKADCERRESCVSGRASGGRGPVARHLQMLAARGEAVAGELENGLGTMARNAARTHSLITEYTKVVSDGGIPTERRAKLHAIDTTIRESFFGRAASAQASLAQAYLAELQAPVAISGQPEASRAVGSLLQSHVDGLKAALDQPSRNDRVLPAFPAPAGTADTLLYASRFWPILVLALVVDIVLPILLWLSAVATKDWIRNGGLPPAPPPPSEDEHETQAILTRHTAVSHPAFDPEAYFPSLEPSSRNRLTHDDWRGRDAS